MLEIKVPSAGESVHEADIGEWLKKEGDFVSKDEIIAILETDKASLELRSPENGALNLLAEEGDTVEVGQVIAKLDTKAEKEAPEKKQEEKAKINQADLSDLSQNKENEVDKTSTENSSKEGIASPAAKKIIAQKNLQAENLTGTGKDGRITKQDVFSLEGKKEQVSNNGDLKSKEINSTNNAFGNREKTVEKMSRIRKVIAKRLVEVKQTTAILTTFNEVDMHEVMEVRKKYKEQFLKKHGVKLGFMSFFTKACVSALMKFPIINSMMDGENIITHQYADIGIAVATPKGLIVPVIRNVENLSIAEIEKQIIHFAGKGRDGTIGLDDITGGTFTITNGGTFGSMLSTPILNHPQSAILGMHNIVQRPIAINGEVVIRPIMYLALTYDHRLIDGAEAVQFLVHVKQQLEDPIRLLLDT